MRGFSAASVCVINLQIKSLNLDKLLLELVFLYVLGC